MLSAGRHPNTWRPATTVTVLVAAVLLAAAAATWATRSHSISAGATLTSPNVLPLMVGSAPTAVQVERAFADHNVRLARDDAAVLRPRFAPIRRDTVAMWRAAGGAHMLIALLGRQADRAVQRLNAEFPPGDIAAVGVEWPAVGRVQPPPARVRCEGARRRSTSCATSRRPPEHPVPGSGYSAKAMVPTSTAVMPPSTVSTAPETYDASADARKSAAAATSSGRPGGRAGRGG